MNIQRWSGALDWIVPFRGRKPVLLEVRSSTLFIIITVCWSAFVDVFLYGIIVPVVPFALQDRVGVPESEVQRWVSVLLAVYAAALLVASPIFGILADKWSSRRAPLLGGLLVLFFSTLMLCIGRSIALLVVGRLLQGASAAIVWTVALALLADTVPESDIGHALGYVSTAMSLGVLIGPLVGGVVYERAGYYAVFGVTFGTIGLDIILRLLLIEKKEAAVWLQQSSIYQSSAIQSSTLYPSTNQSSTIQSINASSGVTIDLDVSSEIASELKMSMSVSSNGAILKKKTKKKKKRSIWSHPLFILLRNRRIITAFCGIFIGAITLTSLDTVLPLFVHETFHWSSLGAGLIFFAPTLPSFLAPVFGYISDNFGPRWISTCGIFLSAPLWLLLRFVDSYSTEQVVLLCALLALLGGATSMFITPLMAEFSKVCDQMVRDDPDMFAGQSAYAQSYGLFNIAYAAGSLVGPLVSGIVKESAGWDAMTWTMALVTAIGVLPTISYAGGDLASGKPQARIDREQRGAARERNESPV